MEPILSQFKEIAASVTYAPPRNGLVSNVTGRQIGAEVARPQYWSDHIRQPVRFADGMQTLHRQGITVFLELGPKPVLLGMGRSCVPQPAGGEAQPRLHWLPSLREEGADLLQLMQSLGTLYRLGHSIRWGGLHEAGTRRIIDLPTYAWQEKRYWTRSGTRSARPSGLAQAPDAALQADRGPDVVDRRSHEPMAIPVGQCYHVAWRRRDRKASPAMSAGAPFGQWIVLTDDIGVGDRLIGLLRAHGHDCVAVEAGDGFTDLGDGRYQVRAASDEDFRSLVLSVAGRCDGRPIGAIHLWSLDADFQETGAAHRLHQQVLHSCGSALLLQKWLSSHAAPGGSRLWLATRGAQQVAEERASLSLSQAPLWGFARTMALEAPDLLAAIVDLSADALPESCAMHLLAEILDADDEEQIAVRDSGRYVARLVRQSPAGTGGPPHRFSDRSAYLITGGLGGIGLRVARWMAERGAGCLVLLGRRGLLPNGAEADDARPGVAHPRRVVDELRAMGVQVHVVSADVGDSEQMARLFGRFGSQWPALRGVVHAAGVIAPKPLAELVRHDLSSVCEAKVSGTWNLHTLTRDLPLDFFVLFSSASSLLGARELAHYAAANHFLDAFATYERRRGRPVCCINWGWWAGGWQDERLAAQFRRAGLNAIGDDEGMAALEAILSSRTAQCLYADIDWRRMVPIYCARKRRPFLDEIHTTTPGPPAADEAASPGLAAELRQTPPDHRLRRLKAFISEKTAALLGFANPADIDARTGFFKLGMDSIMAVELQRQLEAATGLSLPATLAFEFPTMTDLANHLAGLMTQPETVSAGGGKPAEGRGAAAVLADRDVLSEEELIRLLSKKLNEVP
jgi:acyl transferase domain-containing protein/acyl carrier protein